MNTLHPPKFHSFLLLIAISLSISIIFFDQSSIGVLLPSIKKQFGSTELDLAWIVNGYILSLSTLILVSGRIVDHFGPKNIFCFCMMLFVASSFACSVATSDMQIIIFRIAQGVGASMLIPATLVLINTFFDPKERGKIMGTAVTVGACFFSAGPFIGGLLTQYFSWKYVFY